MADGRQCLSGHCVDAVCCNVACTGQCQACDTANNPGTCTNVGTPTEPEEVHPNAAGLDTRAPCTGTGTECGGDCTGSNPNACTYPGDDEELADPICSCPDANCIVGPATENHSRCDGAGSYTDVAEPCGGYRCADANLCKTTCSSDDDCILDFICEEEACVELTGPSCDGEHTVRLPKASDLDCTPFACSGDACLTQCQSVDDCVAPAVCDATGDCVGQLSAPDVPGCSCHLIGVASGSSSHPRWAWLLATLALTGSLYRRRRRSP